MTKKCIRTDFPSGWYLKALHVETSVEKAEQERKAFIYLKQLQLTSKLKSWM